ncbi:hypothetical protein BSL78_02594 [Apostichopus japonicus]|uniref:Uncharacterized protein n=1 Tax=Stichopus japonicus TaxID=307972 RepID=A0A2G8LJS9_STIJA|nr:hypothetical protein BSL78_02594 [Apostichopus japonicus]
MDHSLRFHHVFHAFLQAIIALRNPVVTPALCGADCPWTYLEFIPGCTATRECWSTGRDSVSSRQVMMFPPHLSASEGALHGLSAWPSPYLLPAPLHPQLGSLNPSLYAQFAHVPQGGSSIPQPLHLLSGQSESHPAVAANFTHYYSSRKHSTTGIEQQKFTLDMEHSHQCPMGMQLNPLPIMVWTAAENRVEEEKVQRAKLSLRKSSLKQRVHHKRFVEGPPEKWLRKRLPTQLLQLSRNSFQFHLVLPCPSSIHPILSHTSGPYQEAFSSITFPESYHKRGEEGCWYQQSFTSWSAIQSGSVQSARLRAKPPTVVFRLHVFKLLPRTMSPIPKRISTLNVKKNWTLRQ